MEHHELVQEMASIERMATQDRLKHARKRRIQQLKKYGQYEKQLEKDSSKKQKKQQGKPGDFQRGDKDSELLNSTNKKGGRRRRNGERIRFIANVALLESAARNDLEEVRKLLENSVSPDVTNEDGLTALHQCCIDDNEEMLRLLLEFGANVNACDSEMWTPLHAAATCGHVTLCKHLIDKGAELLAVNADGNMPYDICEDEVTLDYIETEMAKRGITQEQIDDTRLTMERQMLTDLKGLAHSGGDLEVRDSNGASMLHIAAANGYHEVFDFLLDNHVSVDSRDGESWQPIHAAAYWGQVEILELLVQNGADLDSKTKNGETAFDLCEDPDIKQKILDLKDEIETNKASRQRPGSTRKHKQSSRNLGSWQDSVYSSNSSLNKSNLASTSMRRSSVRGEKSSMFKREAHEEALHFGLRMLQDDEDELAEVDEERELPATNIDDVTISIEGLDNDHGSGGGGLNSSWTNNNSEGQGQRLPPQQQQSHFPSADPTTANNRSDPQQRYGVPSSLQSSSLSSSQQKSNESNNIAMATPHSAAAAAVNRPVPAPRGGMLGNPSSSMPTTTSSSSSPRPPLETTTGGNGNGNNINSSITNNRDSNSLNNRQQQQGISAEEREKAEKKQALDAHFQNMFLESLPNNRRSTGGGGVGGRQTTMVEKKNGHNNNNNTNSSTNPAGGVQYNHRDGQLRRFVAPPSAPVVGGEEDDKDKCCVIL